MSDGRTAAPRTRAATSAAAVSCGYSVVDAGGDRVTSSGDAAGLEPGGPRGLRCGPPGASDALDGIDMVEASRVARVTGISPVVATAGGSVGFAGQAGPAARRLARTATK